MAHEPNRAGGGIFLMLAIFVGAALGAVYGQPTIGVLAGVATGTVIAIVIWRRDRARIGE